MKTLSLSGRITLLLGLAAVLILGTAALVMDHMVDTEIGQRMDTALLDEAQTLASLIEIGPHGLDMEHVRQPRRRLIAGQAVEFWVVRCADGSQMTSAAPPPVVPSGWPGNARAEPAFANVGEQGAMLRAVWFGFELHGRGDEDAAPTLRNGTALPCSMLFLHSRADMEDILATIDGILLLIPLLALLAVWLLSPILVRRGLKPLAALGAAMRGIGPQSPGRRLQATGTRELEPLVERFNGVLARMDEGVARERQFAGALAHETRTHLAELRALVEVEQRYPRERPLDELLVEIGKIVGELQGTVSGLLLLTRLEAGIEGMDTAHVRLGEVLDRQLASAAGLLQQRRIRVDQPAVAHDAVLVADRALLDIIVGNLVNNAVAYAPAGDTIAIRRQPRALVIRNTAPDLDADEVARFGQRFWSKHHGADGHAGLGLALAGAAATAMQLELHFTLDAQQRMRATLSWPDALEATRPR